MSEKRCGDCQFWEEEGENTGDGQCHRYPPVLNLVALKWWVRHRKMGVGEVAMKSLPWYRPVADCDDWCGEFRPREESGD